MESVSKQALNLSNEEVELLCAGLRQWGGPARPTKAFAAAMGFGSDKEMPNQCLAIHRSLRADGLMSPLDWARALVSLEIAFSSDLIGAGFEWSTSTGWSDEETIRALRSIQRKLAEVVFPVIRNGGLQAA